MRKAFFLPSLVALALTCLAAAQKPSTPEPVLPYSPSLDVKSMDKSADPCVDFYQYSCGGWKKSNPIPPDQVGWSVYGKLYQDNLNFLRGILEQAALSKAPASSLDQTRIGVDAGQRPAVANQRARGGAVARSVVEHVAEPQ